MNRTDRMEMEYLKAIKQNPNNASLYNDYAVFLNKYRKDFDLSVKYLNRAIKFDPENNIYKSNLNRLFKNREIKNRKKYNIFILFLIGVMLWLGYQGYTNFMNILAIFILAQTILNYRYNLIKEYQKSY